MRFTSLLLIVLASALLTALIAQDRPTMRFDVVSIKENTGSDLSIRSEEQPPDGFRRTNLPLIYYVTEAFQVTQPSRLTGAPDWTRSVRYDIVAKADRPISDDERRAMVRDVLSMRFQLKTHNEQRPQNVYVMTAVRKDGKLGPGAKPRPECATEKCDGHGTGRPDGLELVAIPMPRLASLMSNLVRQLVIDETAITGAYDMTASWRPDTAATDPNDPRPSLFTAMQEQLGLKLEPQRRPVDVLVIDHIERPSPD